MELTFVQEEIPKISRAGGSGREAEPWETHLAPLKEEDVAGQSFRVWTYDKRTSAVSRMSSVRERLTKAVPHENWKLAVRPVPGSETDAEGNTVEPKQGVYVAYEGTFTDEQVADNQRKHDERSARVKAARAAREAAESNGGGAEPAGTEPTAKEKVQAARAAQKQTAKAS